MAAIFHATIYFCFMVSLVFLPLIDFQLVFKFGRVLRPKLGVLFGPRSSLTVTYMVFPEPPRYQCRFVIRTGMYVLLIQQRVYSVREAEE